MNITDAWILCKCRTYGYNIAHDGVNLIVFFSRLVGRDGVTSDGVNGRKAAADCMI